LFFNPPLIKATLLKRHKRFLADVRLENGQELTVHCPNTGSMKTCGSPGDTIWLSTPNASKKERKLPYTWEISLVDHEKVGVNTHRTNELVYEALLDGSIEELKKFDQIKKEVKFHNARFDFQLDQTDTKNKAFLEVKNATLLEKNRILFPDAITERGLKHIQTLIEAQKQGFDIYLLFVVNRSNGQIFTPASQIDHNYTQALQKAHLNGLIILAYRTHFLENEIRLKSKVDVLLE
jgi:sugar fermentation stimulation protein A